MQYTNLGPLTASLILLLCLPGCAPPRTGGVDDPGGGGADMATPAGSCPQVACPAGALCYKGACVPDRGPCTSDDDCQDDSFCDGGRCIPYGPRTRMNDPTCKGGGFTAEKFDAPVIRCEWTRSPVIMSPVVADLDGDRLPEILLVTFDGGNLVALSGQTCAELWSRPAGLGTRSQLAVADLDGDKVPEIIGVDSSGKVLVFDKSGNKLATSSQAASVSGRDGGAAIANLDRMGPPEIVYGGMALRFQGGALTTLYNVAVAGGTWGVLSAIADVDLDGKPDVITGNQILEGMTGADKTPAAARSYPGGYAAIAQIDPATPEPEIILISSSSGREGVVRAYHPKTGATVFGPYTFGQQWGGPPTVADFDGDGKPEIAAAGYAGYAVFDPECAVMPLPAFCKGPGLRWLKQTRDNSSGSTGSSVFDFNGDGQAEVVYRDECWLRVYDGKTGQVRFARNITSGTILELPVIADVNNDGHAEIVVPSHRVGGCAAEPDTGQVVGSGTQGVHVLQDPKNRWMPSRGIWNQHTYHITNINDDATVPLTEMNNWESWNNYRQNVQGMIKSEAPAPDLTAGDGGGIDSTSCAASWTLVASICNRGAGPAAASVPGTFYDGDPRRGGKKLCTARTTKALQPATCEAVRCTVAPPPRAPLDMWFAADDDGGMGAEVECKERNNLYHRPMATCGVIG
jgi:hypothetical protein